MPPYADIKIPYDSEATSTPTCFKIITHLNSLIDKIDTNTVYIQSSNPSRQEKTKEIDSDGVPLHQALNSLARKMEALLESLST